MVKISNKLAYTLMAFAVLALLAVGISALTPGEVPDPGHNINTVAPPSPCAANYYLQFDGTNWRCSSPGDITGVTAGTGLLGGGLSGDVILTADTSYLQRKLTLTTAYNVGPNYGVFSLNMGNHFFCFLTYVDPGVMFGSNSGSCSINLDSPNWWLTAEAGPDATCSARCVD